MHVYILCNVCLPGRARHRDVQLESVVQVLDDALRFHQQWHVVH